MGDKVTREFQFEVYQRRFKQPLRTNHGVWDKRTGIIVTLTDSTGVTSQGEIAPLPWFGTETLDQASNFCQQLGSVVTLKQIRAIPDNLPCCQFALESAWFNWSGQNNQDYTANLDYCCLLPAGESVLTAWQNPYHTQGSKTFKLKLCILSLAEEIELLQHLDRILPPSIKLRLDANGGLNFDQAQQLLSVTDTLSRIEFIEQPLPVSEIAGMFQLSQHHLTPLALDESVASFKQLESIYYQGWQGLYVIKVAIVGFPSRLIDFCRQHSLEIVFSSVFETEVARSAVLNIAQELGHDRALGFGTNLFW